MSLRRRLLFGFLVVAVALVTGGVWIAASMRDALIDQVDRQLDEVSPPAASSILETPRPLPPLQGPSTPPAAATDRLSEFFIARLDADGAEVLRLAPGLGRSGEPLPTAERLRALAASATPTAKSVANVASDQSGGPKYRVHVTRMEDGGFLVVGRSLREVDRSSRRVAMTEAAIAAAVLSTLGLVAWWVLRQGVRPLAEIAATADAIAAGDLSRRVSHIAASTEAGRVGLAFNRMTEQLEEDVRQRAVSEERLKRFVADASHELRTPLTSIRGYVDLWHQGGLSDPPAMKDAMRRVGGEAARMSRLIDDMLLLARLDEGLPLVRKEVDLVRLVDECVIDARVIQPARTIRCTAGVSLPVIGDPDRLRQVVVNLLANALTHTPVSADISVSTRTEGAEAVIDIADQGPGMGPGAAARVFERFVRLDDGRSSSQGGSGLGLAIVAAVVASHGGAVRLSTAPGDGARFEVRIPLTAGALSATS